MLAAALLELLPEPERFVERFNALGIPGVTVSVERTEKCGVTGSRFRVVCDGVEEDEHLHEHHHDGHEHHHHHHHGGLHRVEHIVSDMRLDADAAADVLAVYELIAAAESAVHGVPVDEIHFHEVGTMDAVADVTAVCLLMRELSPDEVVASPVHVGSGTVRCAHGILPVPAPAAAHILKGVPIYGGAIQSELCTPTGAALVKHFADRFDEMPLMIPEAIGYGMGKKDFERANCIRAILGEAQGTGETIAQLQCNVDDMTGEGLGFAMGRLYDAGAAEVFTVPAGMKKSRPGVLLTVLCHEEQKPDVLKALFRHTSTIGVREAAMRRHILDRRIEAVETPQGVVHVKTSAGYGVSKRKWEYDDIANIASEKGMTITEVLRQLGNA